jgi:hypothetical protein
MKILEESYLDPESKEYILLHLIGNLKVLFEKTLK